MTHPITDLNICGVKISQNTMNYICENVTSKLKKLDISLQRTFGDDQFKLVAGRCELEELCMTRTSVSNDSILKNVPKSLAKFETDNKFSFSELFKISSLPSLKFLYIWDQPKNEQEEIVKTFPNLSFSKGAFTYGVRYFWVFFTYLPNLHNQILYYISLFSKFKFSLTYPST